MQHLDHPLDIAARAVGGRRQLATRLHVSAAAIGNWKTRGVPIEYCADIERFTSGTVTRKLLRPDDWPRIWPELARDVDGATTQPAELGPGGDGEGATGHEPTVAASQEAVHHHAGVGR